MAQPTRYLTPRQAADQLTEAGVPVSGETLKRWARAGHIPGRLTPSGQWLFPADGITPDAVLALADSRSDA